MQATLQTKPSDNVFKERNWSHRMHPPFKSWQHQQLHSLNSLRLKHKPRFLHLKHPPIKERQVHEKQNNKSYQQTPRVHLRSKNILEGPKGAAHGSLPFLQQGTNKQQQWAVSSTACPCETSGMGWSDQSSWRQEQWSKQKTHNVRRLLKSSSQPPHETLLRAHQQWH